MIGLKRLIHPLSIIMISLLLTAVLVMIAGMSVMAAEPVAKVDSAATLGNGFILRFDPTLTQFQVITLPTVAGRPRQPHSLAVISHSTNDEIWYTDLGTDRIGRLIYTTTNEYAFTEFDLPVGSEPFDLVANNGYIWFTARSGNWIGRLEINTTQLVTFPVPTANSTPWSIDIGSDDSIWFTEKAASKLGRLIVADTNNFTFMEYPTLGTDAQPQGLTVVHQSLFDLVWYSETVSPNRLVMLDLAQLPPNNYIATEPLPSPSYPVNLAHRGDNIWFTQLLANKVSRILLGTFTDIVSYPVPTANSQPYDLVVDSNKDVWFTERVGGHLGRHRNGVSVLDEYAVPAYLRPIWLQGTALASQNSNTIWLAGFVPHSVYLPAILKGL
jgi:streptogramin lyase